ncbi:hypothetical protein [Kitasatospora griseola]|uniref:hypothetical protein n=1 Tax=Kitasatospora griseola TaxID=2064 RepID=UPI0016700E3A|nr:hypothetical protein [Kitasatospora griseola]GGR06052.1 hypothetical protein GCM10010195_71580 [Kitasatospora griseola]
MHPTIARYASTRDLLASATAAAAQQRQDLRLIAAWRPVADLPALHQAAFAAELAAHLPPPAGPAAALRTRLVWQCTLRTDPDAPGPADHRFQETARRILAATGIATDGDPASFRWALLRLGGHEARLVAPLARPDGSVVDTGRDRSLALAVCQLAESRGTGAHRPRAATAGTAGHRAGLLSTPSPVVSAAARSGRRL